MAYSYSPFIGSVKTPWSAEKDLENPRRKSPVHVTWQFRWFTMTFRSSLLSALVNIRNLVPSFSIILLQPLVHWRSKKSEKSHKLLSDLSGMVTQFNKISSPVSLFFLQGKFLSFYWIKEYWTFSTFENSDYFLTIVLRNDFDLETVKGCPHSFLFFFWKINFGCFENIIRNSLLALSVRQTKMEMRIRCDWKLWFLVCLKAKIGDWDNIPFPDIKGIEIHKVF